VNAPRNFEEQSRRAVLVEALARADDVPTVQLSMLPNHEAC